MNRLKLEHIIRPAGSFLLMRSSEKRSERGCKMISGKRNLTGPDGQAGKLGEYFPLIDFSEKVHLGKNTSFGLGKIKAEVVS